LTDGVLDLASQLAGELNNEFEFTNFTAGDDLLIVVNGISTSNNFAVWHFVESGGVDVTAGELTLIGKFNSNGDATTGNFGFAT
jgi:hypothetical protein